MDEEQRSRPGFLCGVTMGLKLLEIPIESLVPQRIARESVAFSRSLLGIYSLGENAVAAIALGRHPQKWTPDFRKDLAEAISSTAIRSETTITLHDILRLRVELEHFCKFYIDWLNRDGVEAVVGSRYSFQDAFKIMQELRSLQFSAMVASSQTEQSNLPVSAQKFSDAIVRATHMWVLGTTTFSDESMAETDKVVDSVCAIARAACDAFLGDEKCLKRYG